MKYMTGCWDWPFAAQGSTLDYLRWVAGAIARHEYHCYTKNVSSLLPAPVPRGTTEATT